MKNSNKFLKTNFQNFPRKYDQVKITENKLREKKKKKKNIRALKRSSK